MKTALFVNFTNQEFTGYWNGKGRTYPPGAQEYLPDYLAQHFATHLTNRELLRTDASGSLIHKGGDKMTSPKKPQEVPLFMELFNKAYLADNIADNIDDIGDKNDDLNALIDTTNKNRAKKLAKVEAKIKNTPPLSSPRQPKPQEDENFAKPKGQDPLGPQIIIPPDWNENDDEEGSFKGKPVENAPAS